MESNILFESNVYPVNGSIISDREYLSRIWDYNRLRSIDQRFYHNVPWTASQSKIIKEQPTCAQNKGDPCWGMVKTRTGYKWICMCTKTECSLFKSCRSENLFDPESEAPFIPKTNVIDEYGYSKFISEYPASPVLVGDEIAYDATTETIIREKNNSENGNAGVVYAPALLGELIKQHEPPKEEGGEETDEQAAVKDSKLAAEKVPAEEAREQRASIPEIVVNTVPLNIFEHFNECTQDAVIRATRNKSFFVDAGPGTGKTYTLVQKLNYMVSQEGVEADGILVLCFTNAAVDEIKTRLREFVHNGADRSLVNVDIRTFHSFAWWLINQANSVLGDSGWNPVPMMSLTYEASLLQASEIMSKFGKTVVGAWEYFIVDEVQDLTNTLGRFVLKIVNACFSASCGVTVLGDACQAIYDYDQETAFPFKSKEFYRELFKQMQGKADFVYLTGNHRQNSELIELTSGLRNAILSDDKERMLEEVAKISSSAPHDLSAASLINDAFIEKHRAGKTLSFLLRNNGQTLKMSSDLRKRGVPHTLNITETNYNFAPWIADVFGAYKKPVISEDCFLEKYQDSTGDNGSEVWNRLQRLMHTDNDVLNVRELLDAIAKSRIDDSLLRASRTMDTIVSNIHRAKGREYDSVIVDNSFVESFSRDTPTEEYKTLYVAITRPKTGLLLADLQKRSGMKIITVFDTKRKRWGKTKNKKIAYFEFDSSKDLDISTFAAVPPNVISAVSVGDPVWLKRKLVKGFADYLIVHEPSDAILGSLGINNPYSKDLAAYMRIDAASMIEMPSTITDLYVSGVYSQVVDSTYIELHPEIKEVAANGVWKWVELVGIGHADYDVY